MSSETPKRCGTCKWWAWNECTYGPYWLTKTLGDHCRCTDYDDGEDCPCWQPKGETE